MTMAAFLAKNSAVGGYLVIYALFRPQIRNLRQISPLSTHLSVMVWALRSKNAHVQKTKSSQTCRFKDWHQECAFCVRLQKQSLKWQVCTDLCYPQ